MENRKRDIRFKTQNDPFTAISRSLELSGSSSKPLLRPWKPLTHSSTMSLEDIRTSRESSERQRALALIAVKRREAGAMSEASATPSTVRGGGYSDVFNRREVALAAKERDGRRGRESWRDQRW